MRLFLRFIYILLSLLIGHRTFAQCRSDESPLRYQVGQGEYPAFIMRKFKLEPLWCENCAVKKFLRLNHLDAQVKLEPGSWVFIPQRCESLKRSKVEKVPFPLGVPMPAVSDTPLKIVTPPKVMKEVLTPDPQPEAPLYVRSPLSGNGVVIASKETGLLYENGKNDWSKIECRGERTAHGCVMHHGFQELRLSNRFQNFSIKSTVDTRVWQVSSLAQPELNYFLNISIYNAWSAVLELGASYLRFSESNQLIDSDKTIYGRGFLGIALIENFWDLQLDIGKQEFPSLLPSTGSQLAVLAADFNTGRLQIGLRPLSDRNFWKISLQFSNGISSRATDPGLRQVQAFGIRNEFCIAGGSECDWIYGLDLGYQKFDSEISTQSQSAAVLSVSRRWGN